MKENFRLIDDIKSQNYEMVKNNKCQSHTKLKIMEIKEIML